MPGPANLHLGKICIEMQLVEQGTGYQEKRGLSGDVIPSLAHLKCLGNSLYLAVPHCKHGGGKEMIFCYFQKEL